MPQVDRDGVGIAYESYGSGPPVLWTHGFGATMEMWRAQVEALAADYRVIVWDLRGHGSSDSPSDIDAYDHEAAVADMCAVLDACGERQAVIAGLSLGGFLSLAFHLRYPDRTTALILSDTGPGYRGMRGRRDWNRFAESWARDLEERGSEALGRSVEMTIGRHRDITGIVRAARGTLTQRDAAVIESLPSISVPTLILAGADDDPYVRSSEYMAERIPGARFELIAEAGHAPNIERPEAFNRAVLTFLEDGFSAS